MLELSSLSKRYAEFAFGPLDLTVRNEVLSVLGPSGSGKTTLLSLIAGTAEPDGGTISLNGRRLDGRPIADRETGLVFQDGALFPHLTARENITYAATDPDRVDELAATFELADLLDRRPPTLSGGERQRVALARTLAADPAALLLDEPLSSLDAPIRRRLRDELHALFTDLDIPIVYVTHDQRTATALGDRLAVIRDGTIEQLGTPSDVVSHPETPFVASFTGTENVFAATVTGSTDGTTVRIGELALRSTETAETATGSTVTACIHPARLQLTPTDSGDAGATNTVSGVVEQWLNEGTDYRVSISVEGVAESLTATVRPAAVDGLSIDPGSPLRLTIPPDAVHLISSSAIPMD
ncbi:ABC transporter ATP-binding protein [Halohasta litorea]|uniref:Molybdate/tungstate import ATP-binding protein WtpC n=1 Tax=Halohasta litorea TaxID=869891 RepID=A0ABD6D4W1_9EURY|nr:ABC transporter ATP-binding protein [Halohasta litorea]